MSCGGNCHNSNYVNGILNRCKISNGGKNLVNNFNQRISNLENGELDLTNVSTDIVPSENEAFDLGSNEKRFKDLYLSGNTIDLGGTKLSANSSGELVVSNENGEDVLNKSTKFWDQLGEDIDGEAPGSGSGWSVSLSDDGTRVVIGAPFNSSGRGQVRVYEYSDSNESWTQLGENIDGIKSLENFGWSVSLSGDGNRIAIGGKGFQEENFGLSPGVNGIKHIAQYFDSTGFNGTGVTRVYDWNGNSWSKLGDDIVNGDFMDNTGYSVSLNNDGTVVAVGSRRYDNEDSDNNNKGGVDIYKLINNNWEKLGNSIIGEADDDQSGWSVSLSSDGSIIAIGAPGNNSSSGHTRVFKWNGSDWIQLGQDIDGEASGNNSGWSVSLSDDGTRVAIGAYGNDGKGDNSGQVRIYEYNNNVWVQLGQDIDGEASGDQSGESVSLSADGTIVAIGAPWNDDNGNNSGQVRIYGYSNNVWTQIGQDIDGEASIDYSGTRVSLSYDGTKVAIGAPFNDDNGNASGQVRVFQLSNYNEIENLYVSSELKFKENNEIKSINSKANLESPVFTGSPEVPTQAVENNNKIINNTMLIESVNNINGSTISNSIINNTTLKGNINYEDSVENRNPMLYLNIIEVSEDTTIPNNSSGLYVNTSDNSIDLILSSDNSKTKTLTSGSNMLVYTSNSEIYGFATVAEPELQPLELKGIMDFDTPDRDVTGKAIHLYANQYIENLSNYCYGIGVANNGGGSNGQEYTFPSMSVDAGSHILVCRSKDTMDNYMNASNIFDYVLQDNTSEISQNGDDAIELFKDGVVIETFGDINRDGTGLAWEYTDSWAYKDPSGTVTFGSGNWIFGGINVTDGTTTIWDADKVYPFAIGKQYV